VSPIGNFFHYLTDRTFVNHLYDVVTLLLIKNRPLCRESNSWFHVGLTPQIPAAAISTASPPSAWPSAVRDSNPWQRITWLNGRSRVYFLSQSQLMHRRGYY